MLFNKIKIIERDITPFRDRIESGYRLSEELLRFKDKGAVVVGIPRGGVIVAWQIATRLKAELDVILTRKLGAPGNPELAIGAVNEAGKVFIEPRVVGELNVAENYIELEKTRQLQVLHLRSAEYRKIRPRVTITNKITIITDDGIATGSTMQAAVWSCRQDRPLKLIVALPVAPEDALKKFADSVDEIICLKVPPFLGAISQFYEDFEQVPDEQVMEILREAAAKTDNG